MRLRRQCEFSLRCWMALTCAVFGLVNLRGEELQSQSNVAPSQAPPIPPMPVPVESTRLRDGVWRLGKDKHLFVDAMGLDTVEGISFTVTPPRAVQVVFKSENPWESIAAYSNVLDDGTGTYKIYYQSSRHDWVNMAVATSTDGINWTKPHVGAIEFQGSKDNNIVIDSAGGGSVYFDPRDPDPARRYKFLCNYPIDDRPDTPTTEGMVIYTSADGIHWTKHEFNVFPYIQDSQAVLLRDPAIDKYVVFFRGNDEQIGRKVMRGETDDPMKPWPYMPNPNPLVMSDHELPYMSTELPVVMSHDEWIHLGPAFTATKPSCIPGRSGPIWPSRLSIIFTATGASISRPARATSASAKCSWQSAAMACTGLAIGGRPISSTAGGENSTPPGHGCSRE